MSDGDARLPPFNLEAEQAVVGSLLLDRETIVMLEATDLHLEPIDFYHGANGIIFGAVRSLYHRKIPTDLITLTDELARVNLLDQAGGVAYVTSLLNSVPTAVHAEYYAGIVRRLSDFRKLIDAGSRIVSMGWKTAAEPADLIADAKGLLAAIEGAGGSGAGMTFAEAVPAFAERLQERWEAGPRYIAPSLPTGLRTLDHGLRDGGLNKGDLVVILARPSMGKSALMLQMALNTARRNRHRQMMPEHTMIFSTEMTLEALLMRALAEMSRYSTDDLRDGYKLKPEGRAAILAILVEMERAPIWIDDSSAPTMEQVVQRVARFQADAPVCMVMFDYLERAGSRRHANEKNGMETKVSEAIRSLKTLAKDANVVSVALSQVSRDVAERADKMPQLSDIRWAATVEQEADLALALNRAEYYDKDCPPTKRGTCDIKVLKQRDGMSGQIATVRFLETLTAFEDVNL